MLWLHNWIMLSCLKTAVSCYTTAVVEYLNHCAGCANIHLFSNQIGWNRIFITAIRDEIVHTDLRYRPDCRFKITGRKGQHICFFFFLIGTAPSTNSLLKLAVIQFIKFLCNRILNLNDREEFLITQCSNDPRFGKSNRTFCMTLIFRLANPSRNNRCAIADHR